jgi:hypothetical protein
MTGSKSNSLTHEQDFQTLINELTIKGQALLLESDQPVLDEEEDEEDFFAIPPTRITTTS